MCWSSLAAGEGRGKGRRDRLPGRAACPWGQPQEPLGAGASLGAARWVPAAAPQGSECRPMNCPEAGCSERSEGPKLGGVIQDVDEALRALVRREALEGTGVDIAFDAPT